MQELPNVKLCIVESMTGYIVDWLRDGRLDIGLVFSDDTISGIQTEPLLIEELYLAAASDERLAPLLGPDGDVPFASFVGEPLILPTRRHGLRTVIDHVARQHGIDHTVQIEIDSFPEIQRLVRRNLGLTILSLAALHESEFTAPLRTARIVAPSIRRTVALAYADDRSLTKATREIGKLVSDILRTHAASDWWRAVPA
jgi:LysR family nitrogen assimilation transcriptional regulator